MSKLRRAIKMLLGKRPNSLQVGALCIDAENKAILLITSRGTGRWVIPKGWPMGGCSLAEAAAKEAWEEAGIRGRVADKAIGRYRYDKMQDDGFAIPVEVAVFSLQVESCHSDFPESHERQLSWFPPQEAALLVSEPGLKRIMRNLQLADA